MRQCVAVPPRDGHPHIWAIMTDTMTRKAPAPGVLGPATAPETRPVRAILLGERLDTRTLEGQETLATAPLTLRLLDGGTAVLFRYGAVITFDSSAAATKAFVETLMPNVVGPYKVREADETRLKVDPAADEQIDPAGIMVVRDLSTVRLQVIADVLAKSLVLAHHETRIAAIFDRIEPLAAGLREKGLPGARGRDLLREIGDVLLMQHRMVGRVETGEKPELLWDHPELERLYLRFAEEYELRDRDRALNRKLELISRTAETLLGLVQSRSSARVEWYIVALIVAELVLSIYPLFFGR